MAPYGVEEGMGSMPWMHAMTTMTTVKLKYPWGVDVDSTLISTLYYDTVHIHTLLYTPYSREWGVEYGDSTLEWAYYLKYLF